ncbi:unnamed protein product [Lasius platythorax]|uniref:Uncharacterized protein n=1 Tax=Lasius platythorax TaxID=488582 RepID=A0AAV2N5K3_9HYME
MNFKSSWQLRSTKEVFALAEVKPMYSAVIFWAYIDWCHSVPGSKLELLLLPIPFQMSGRCLEVLCRKDRN